MSWSHALWWINWNYVYGLFDDDVQIVECFCFLVYDSWKGNVCVICLWVFPCYLFEDVKWDVAWIIAYDDDCAMLFAFWLLLFRNTVMEYCKMFGLMIWWKGNVCVILSQGFLLLALWCCEWGCWLNSWLWWW